jgi:phage-related protein
LKIRVGAAAAATGLLTAAKLKLARAIAIVTSTTFLIVAGIVALVAAFIYAWKNSETFRDRSNQCI